MRQYAGYSVIDKVLPLGNSLESVHTDLLHSYEPLTLQCIVCGNPPQYRLVPKKAELDTHLAHSKGYSCKHCLHALSQTISPQDYAIQELN